MNRFLGKMLIFRAEVSAGCKTVQVKKGWS